jgi:hypothetical protein
MKDGMDILKTRNFNAAEESFRYRGLKRELLPTQFEGVQSYRMTLQMSGSLNAWEGPKG